MKKILIFLLVCQAILPSEAAVTTLKGKVVPFISGNIRLAVYSDMISYKKEILDVSEINPDGSFTLSADLDETTYAFIEANYQSGEIFLEPGIEYDMTISLEDGAGQQAYYDRGSLTYSIDQQTGEDLNSTIQEINLVYNDFLLENAHLLQSTGGKEKVKEVSASLLSLVDEKDNDYLLQYTRYKIASLELFFRVTSNDRIAGQYLTDQPVLYGNVEYMDFFHVYFEKYLVTNNPYFPYSKISALVNGDATYKAMVEELIADPVLNDPRLAELVLLSGLNDMSAMTGFKKDRIILLLDQVMAGSSYEKHRMIASNLKEKILWMRPGTPAPQFELNDINGTIHALSDYQGKYLYISFISLQSIPSLTEMNLLADIYPDYRDRFEFISILVDKPGPGWLKVIEDYRMQWDVLLSEGDYVLLEKYGAIAPPVFILLDPEGNIQQFPAPSPSENLKGVLDSF